MFFHSLTLVFVDPLLHADDDIDPSAVGNTIASRLRIALRMSNFEVKVDIQRLQNRESAVDGNLVFGARVGVPGGIDMKGLTVIVKEQFPGCRTFIGTSRRTDTMLVSSGGTLNFRFCFPVGETVWIINEIIVVCM